MLCLIVDLILLYGLDLCMQLHETCLAVFVFSSGEWIRLHQRVPTTADLPTDLQVLGPATAKPQGRQSHTAFFLYPLVSASDYHPVRPVHAHLPSCTPENPVTAQGNKSHVKTHLVRQAVLVNVYPRRCLIE